MFRVVTPPIITSTSVITASGTGQTISATFPYRGADGTDDGWSYHSYHPKHVEQFTEI